ncbi:MAG TPA: DUF2079 domain-containing protein, partial [Ktedonobacteraceae bacterium]|nr:DUF2079 domain-containing protein [Ktedonobacteraceae bacterium]
MSTSQAFVNLILQELRLVWSRGFYPKPKPMPRARSFWITQAVVLLAMLAYILYFSFFLINKHNAFRTNGEDLGIMDQAIWSLLHGSLFNQTICNPLTDTNCYGLGGISRFAIHYEPILFPISLIYLVWANPIVLMVFQVLVVASGALPAFWLARLRLRNNWAAVAFPLLYLLYPAQQYAVNFDFHAVTLTISLLLFALYFLYTRKTISFFIFIVLCLACKEEIAGVVLMLGLWTIILQRRYRVGLGLIVLALLWTGLGLLVVHYASPLGHSLLASRYAYLGTGPLQIAKYILSHPISLLQQHLWEGSHRLYLVKLLEPAGLLPLFAPWALILALPTLALNLLSSTPNMYSGDFQYSAEIIPILIFSAIEGVVVILWIANKLLAALNSKSAEEEAPPLSLQQKQVFSPVSLARVFLLTGLLVYMLCSVYNSTTKYDVYSVMPYARGFIKIQVTPHNLRAYHFLNEIPPDASVATQTSLVPHLSERKSIYLFPYATGNTDYILLDASGYIYPFRNYAGFAT